MKQIDIPDTALRESDETSALAQQIHISMEAAAVDVDTQPQREHSPSAEQNLKHLADLATNLWKATEKMKDSSGQIRDEMKRVYRHIEGALESVFALGLEVKDHTGDTFDYGLPLKIVTTQPMENIERETIIETIKPTIYFKQSIVQVGEIVIATPTKSST